MSRSKAAIVKGSQATGRVNPKEGAAMPTARAATRGAKGRDQRPGLSHESSGQKWQPIFSADRG